MKREPGIDLIRLTGLFFVVGVHFFLYNGFYYAPQKGWAIWLADCVRWLFFSCNGIFMMLTGYLRSRKPLGPGYCRCLIPVLLAYFLVSFVSIPIRHLVFHEEYTLAEWTYKLLSFGGAYYGWYIGMHVGLILLSPVLNIAVSVSDRKTLLLLVGSLLTATALPSVTDLSLLPTWWEGCYPLTYYLLGAAIARLQPRVRPVPCLAAAAATAVFLGTVTYYTAPDTIDGAFVQGYGGFWITLIALFVFLGLYHLSPGPRICRVLCWAAGTFPEGYLLSHLLDAWAYNLFPRWKTPGAYPLLFVCVTVPIFLCSIPAGKAMHFLAVRISGRIQAIRLPGRERV